jgi:HEAT repeat protein
MRERIVGLLRKRLYTDDEIRALGRDAVPDVVALLAAPGEEIGGGERLALVHMLGVLGGAQAVAALAGIFRDAAGRDETLQVAAAEALARTGDPAALALVLPLLDSGEKRLRKNVLTGLAATDRPEVLARVRVAAEADADDAVRREALDAVRAIEERLA